MKFAVVYYWISGNNLTIINLISIYNIMPYCYTRIFCDYQVVRGFSSEVYTAIGSTSAKHRVPRKDAAQSTRPTGINVVLVVSLSVLRLT